jgi:hypothetical protein
MDLYIQYNKVQFNLIYIYIYMYYVYYIKTVNHKYFLDYKLIIDMAGVQLKIMHSSIKRLLDSTKKKIIQLTKLLLFTVFFNFFKFSL